MTLLEVFSIGSRVVRPSFASKHDLSAKTMQDGFDWHKLYDLARKQLEHRFVEQTDLADARQADNQYKLNGDEQIRLDD